MNSHLTPYVSTRGVAFYSLKDSIFYYRNDPNTEVIRFKWIAIDSPSLDRPLRSAAEPRLTYDYAKVRNEILQANKFNFFELDGRTLLTTDHWLAGNICHILFDHLYRYWLASCLGLSFDNVIIISEAWPWLKFVVRDVLNIANIYYIKPGVAYRCKEIHFCSNSFPEDTALPQDLRGLRHPGNKADPDYLKFLRSRFLSFQSKRSWLKLMLKPRRVFISRLPGSLRSFHNLMAIETAFRINGFDILYMEKLSPVSQIHKMRHCTHIAGLHGAGMTNIIAANDHTRILEIFSDKGTVAYQRIAKNMGHEYFLIDNRQNTNPFILPIFDLEQKLSFFLQFKTRQLRKLLFIGSEEHPLLEYFQTKLQAFGYQTLGYTLHEFLASIGSNNAMPNSVHGFFVHLPYNKKRTLLRLRLLSQRPKLIHLGYHANSAQHQSLPHINSIKQIIRNVGYTID